MHRIGALSFVVSTCLTLLAVDVRAACSASVSASVSGPDLIVTASGGGQCGASSLKVFIDGEEKASKGCDSAHCTGTWTLPAACYRTGSHTVTAIASCGRQNSDSCEADPSSITGTASFTVNTTPEVSVSHEVDQFGLARFRVMYNFPNTSWYEDRHLQLLIDGKRVRETGGFTHVRLESQSGVWETDLDMACYPSGPHQLKVIATACGRFDDPDYTAEATQAVSIDTTPRVSVQHVQATGRLRIEYTFPNTSFWGLRAIDVYKNEQLVVSTDSARSNPHPLDQISGVWEPEIDTTCSARRTDDILVIARACGKTADDEGNESYIARARTRITTDPKPSVSLSQSEDASGNDTLTVQYSFPYTREASQRLIQVVVDGVTRTSLNPDRISGSFTVSLGTVCWQSAKAIATACGRTGDARFTHEATIRSTLDKPVLSATIGKSRILAEGALELRVKYDLKEAVAGRFVRVEQLSWIGVDGRTHSDRRVIAMRDATDPRLSDTWILRFNPPARARQIRLHVTASACGVVERDVSFDCGDGTRNPVFFADGNMRLADVDPLPRIAGRTLTRTYDSDEQTVGLFGRGFTTLLDQRLMRDVVNDREVVSIVTDTNEVVTFNADDGIFRQTWPTAKRTRGSLLHDPANATYTYRPGDSSVEMVFRGVDGKLITLRDRPTGREGRLSYVNGTPQKLTDSWTAVEWRLTLDGHRVTSIAIGGQPDLVWTYTYDASDNLIQVRSGGVLWRSYEYSAGNRLTVSRDAEGHLIESHDYDANGFAINSTGPDDEIAGIEYLESSVTQGEYVTRVTLKAGEIIEYLLRPSGGSYRVVEARGSCTSCGGGGDRTYVRDDEGRIVREQHPDGFITATTYDDRRVVAEQHYLRPSHCDPLSAADQCRLTSDALAAVPLQPTPATVTSTYAYSDPRWPDHPTTITSPSVLVAGQLRHETFSYHPISGTVLAAITSGIAGAEHDRAAIGVTTMLYEARANGDDSDESGDPNADLRPAFDPGGIFESTWMTLPQPSLLVKAVDSRRNDIEDVMSFVYYPIDSSVPALLRGQLAAERNALGHVTRYENYDVFGNACRVIDPNGVVTETTYDALGRRARAALKGVPGCDRTREPLCSTDLITTWTYSPATGALSSVELPDGSVIVYDYDTRGRVAMLSRGPTLTDLRERLEYAYDSATGKISAERRSGQLAGSWTAMMWRSFSYNSKGQLTEVNHATEGSESPARVKYAYDAAGRLTTVTDENHAEPNTTYSYDSAGRLSLVRQKLAGSEGGWISTTYAYDLGGNLASMVDPNGNVTTYIHDDFGSTLRHHSPATGVTSFEYDAAGNLIRTTDANGASTTRTYDALNRLISSTSAHTGNSTPPDDDDDRGGGDDSLPPPTNVSRTEIVTWLYDDLTTPFSVGRLSRVTDPAGVTAYEYERRGLAIQERRTFGGCFVTRESGVSCDDAEFQSRTFVTSYEYDRNGNRSNIAYPSERLHVRYKYDYAGRPVSASGAIEDAEYLPFGPLRRLRFANGTTQDFSYDRRYRMTRNFLRADKATLADYLYRFDRAGNIVAIDDVVDPRYSRAFAYDDMHRLVSANTGSALWRNATFEWNAIGDPRTITIGQVVRDDDDEATGRFGRVATEAEWRPGGRTQVFSYVWATPRIDRVTSTTSPSPGEGELLRVGSRAASISSSSSKVIYDAAGNELAWLVTRTYSPRNLLLEVVRQPDEPGNGVEHKILYAYDARGIRVVRGEQPSDGISAVARRYYIYTPELKLLSVTKDDVPNIWSSAAVPREMESEIVWFGGRPVAQVRSSAMRVYTHTDHLGTPLLQTDDNGMVVWHAEYEPFGNVYQMRRDSNGDDIGQRRDQPLRLPGQEVAMAWEGAEETYNIFRWYRTAWGRYTQGDPLASQPGAFLPAVTGEFKTADPAYSYVRANPLTSSDVLGLRTCTFCSPDCPSGRWAYVDVNVGIALIFGRSWGRSTIFCVGNSVRCTFSYRCNTVGIQSTIGGGGGAGFVEGDNCKCADDLPVGDSLTIGPLQINQGRCTGGGLSGGAGMPAGRAGVFGQTDCVYSPIRCTGRP